MQYPPLPEANSESIHTETPAVPSIQTGEQKLSLPCPLVIFLSGLQTIPQSMYEAADIEGCTKWESLWKITFPMISSLFLVNWIYTIVDFCMRSDNEVIDKISEVMVQQINYGLGSAMAWVYFVIVMVIIGISSLIISKGVYYYE